MFGVQVSIWHSNLMEVHTVVLWDILYYIKCICILLNSIFVKTWPRYKSYLAAVLHWIIITQNIGTALLSCFCLYKHLNPKCCLPALSIEILPSFRSRLQYYFLPKGFPRFSVWSCSRLLKCVC